MTRLLYPLSVRTWLFILVLACWVPLGFLLFSHFLVSGEAAARELAVARMQELARATASTLELTLRDHEDTLKLIAAGFSGGRLDRMKEFNVAQFIALHPLVDNIAVHNLDVTRLHSPLAETTPTQPAQTTPWVQAALTAEGFTANNAVRERTSRRWVSEFTYPTRGSAGERTGFVSTAIDLMRLNTRLLSELPGNTVVAVFDRKGDYLLRSSAPEQWIGQPGPREMAELSPAQSQGQLRLKSGDGVDKLVAYVTIQGTGWRVASGVPVQLAMADYYAFRRKTLLMGFVLVLGSLALAWRIANQIAVPITALANASSQLAESDQTITVVPHGPSEIQAVAMQFNQMVLAQKKSRTKLAESEARWKFALEGSGNGVWDWDIASGSVFYSRRCNEILGFGEGELPGTIAEWASRTHPDDYQKVVDAAKVNLSRNAAPYAAEFRARCKNNVYKWISVRGLVVARDPTGRALRMVGTITDISKTKQIDDERRTAAIAFESQMPLYILNADRHFERINQAFKAMTGLGMAGLEGQTLAVLSGKDAPERALFASFWQSVEASGEASLEFMAQGKSGTVVPMRTNLSVVRNDDSRTVAYVGTLTDITEKMRNRLVRAAEQEAQRTALVREVHHRVKNNLQGMVGILREFGRNHPETTEPLAEVIGQIQSISVIHGLQGQTSRAQVRLCELTEAIASSIRGARSADIRFHKPLLWQPHEVASKDAVPVALIVNELILNAVKHGNAANGPVLISVENGNHPGAVRVRIGNHGNWTPDGLKSQVGLKLVDTLLPRQGAVLSRSITTDWIETIVDLEPPVIALANREPQA